MRKVAGQWSTDRTIYATEGLIQGLPNWKYTFAYDKEKAVCQCHLRGVQGHQWREQKTNEVVITIETTTEKLLEKQYCAIVLSRNLTQRNCHVG